MTDQDGYLTKEIGLIFVYNARSDIFSKVTDFAHKIISPATYSCSLCILTHGNMGMHKEWEDFLLNLPYPVSFLYKDQVEEHPGTELPQIWLQEGQEKKVLIDAVELKAVPSLEALMELIRERLGM